MSENAPAPSAPNTPNPQPGQQAQQPNPAAQTAPNQPRRINLAEHAGDEFVYVVEGKEVVLKGNDLHRRFGREDQSERRYQDAKKAREEAAAQKAELQAEVERLSRQVGDPAQFRAFLAANGITPAQYAKAMLEAEEREAALSPAERELKRMREAEQARQEQEAKAAEEAHAQQVQAHKQAYAKAFNSVMSECGIPERSATRDILLPTLSMAAAYLQREEGRQMTRKDARIVVENALREMGSLRAPPRDQLLEQLTEDDWKAWQAKKSAAKPQAAPPLPRGNDGRFVTPGDDTRGNPMRRPKQTHDVNGRVIMRGATTRAWGDKM